jgi:hypothetical protein
MSTKLGPLARPRKPEHVKRAPLHSQSPMSRASRQATVASRRERDASSDVRTFGCPTECLSRHRASTGPRRRLPATPPSGILDADALEDRMTHPTIVGTLQVLDLDDQLRHDPPRARSG